VPPALADTRPELAALDAILAAALAKNPNDRFARCSDFACALAEQSPTHSPPAAAAPTARAPAGGPLPPSGRQKEGHAEPASQHGAKRLRRLWLTGAAATTVLVLAAAAKLVWKPWHNSQSASATTSSAPPVAIPAPSPPPPGSSQSASATPVVLPDVPPPNSGCEGTVTAHHDILHKTLGAVRVFLLLNTSAQTGNQGCISAVASSGKVLPAILVDARETFGFANPATDATGNTFVTYNPGRYNGVLVLIPNANGFEDIGLGRSQFRRAVLRKACLLLRAVGRPRRRRRIHDPSVAQRLHA
jgi:hypothetical protein